MTVDETTEEFPQTSASLLYETITKTLGYLKSCAWWVLEQTTKKPQSDNCLYFIITVDETWVAHYTRKTNCGPYNHVIPIHLRL